MYYISLPNLSSWITWAGTNVSVRINNTTHPVPLPSGQALFSRHTALALKPSNLISLHILREDVTEKNPPLGIAKITLPPNCTKFGQLFHFCFCPKSGKSIFARPPPRDTLFGHLFSFSRVSKSIWAGPPPFPKRKGIFFWDIFPNNHHHNLSPLFAMVLNGLKSFDLEKKYALDRF